MHRVPIEVSWMLLTVLHRIRCSESEAPVFRLKCYRRMYGSCHHVSGMLMRCGHSCIDEVGYEFMWYHITGDHYLKCQTVLKGACDCTTFSYWQLTLFFLLPEYEWTALEHQERFYAVYHKYWHSSTTATYRAIPNNMSNGLWHILCVQLQAMT